MDNTIKNLQFLQGNYLGWISIVMAAILLLMLLSGCVPNTEVDEPGGHKDYTDPNAPKKIESTVITNFDYEFYSGSLEKVLYGLTYEYGGMQLERVGEICFVKVWGLLDGEVYFVHEYMTPLASLDALQAVIEKHNLAQYNGIKNKTSGIPSQLGSSFKVVYESGESIYTYDNAGQVLGVNATKDLIELFTNLEGNSGYGI